LFNQNGGVKNESPHTFGEEASRKRLQLEFARGLLREREPFEMSGVPSPNDF
jgi:hypothetical protein